MSFAGNPPNTIGFDEEAQDSEFALQIVGDVHELWLALMARESDPEDLARACTECESDAKISADQAEAILDVQPESGPDTELDSEIDKNYFANMNSGSVKLSSFWMAILTASLMSKVLFRNRLFQ